MIYYNVEFNPVKLVLAVLESQAITPATGWSKVHIFIVFCQSQYKVDQLYGSLLSLYDYYL